MFKLSQALILSICLAGCNQVSSQNSSQTQPSKEENKAQPLAAAPANKELHSPGVKAEKLPQPILDKVSAEDIKQLHSQLKALTQDVTCDTTMQCQVEAVGSRACGGPSSYIVYSNKSADSEAVKKLASKITHYESSYNAQNRLVSICQHLTRPSAQCVENKCVKLTNTSQETF
ncbi:hypothetical protein PA25_00330 [Pseudoalteromonas sp. A25]|uniref:hypothetical protein n=1 Tax=Pseudoalteromonas sp. A25 TaxID=116092 RepID=UPI0012610F52|nr:hypothetical protein [Pseudoalteromonas sp. A25]BBN80048.1 hypothetical protein PA25_00330 [Pseudoalteromonas sp. A25]